jgi:hypothetical protein
MGCRQGRNDLKGLKMAESSDNKFLDGTIETKDYIDNSMSELINSTRDDGSRVRRNNLSLKKLTYSPIRHND